MLKKMERVVLRRIVGLLICVASLGASLLIAFQPVGLHQKEIRTQVQHVDGGPGELDSLETLVERSDAVVIGRVTGGRSSNLTPVGLPDEAGLLSTAYAMTVSTVVVWPKSDSEKPGSLEIEMAGVGDHDRGSYILRFLSERYRPLATGREYLVFLRRYQLGPAGSRISWVPATGDGQSILEIRQGHLAPQATTSLALSLAKLSPTALIAEVHKIRK